MTGSQNNITSADITNGFTFGDVFVVLRGESYINVFYVAGGGTTY